MGWLHASADAQEGLAGTEVTERQTYQHDRLPHPAKVMKGRKFERSYSSTLGSVQGVHVLMQEATVDL